ncbi:Ig-like domain-containing protein [Streptococcus pacificus]|uniref:LPXTG cell wall anchor domain-containing protein n=1 Tax=Streptococcus pacificus TaxID=2740577 RepID=A0ABS0ZKC3_9STRE|nr:Ig-like domain-containing protein [Streptococcus pacificus]MBJ8326452.1 LPXTG cell wall anchor domain-containing protein [Streptococcus pacificus]
MMKKLTFYFLALVLLIPVLLGISRETVKTDEVGDVVTKVYVTDNEGNPLTGSVRQWQQFRIGADFTLPNNQVKSGDTTVITIPEELEFSPMSQDFKVLTKDDEIVANAEVKTNRQIVLTYTDYVEKNSDISGSLYIYVRVDHNKFKENKDITASLDVNGKLVPGDKFNYEGIGNPHPRKLSKSGWRNEDDPQIIEYLIAVNRDKQALPGVQILDQLTEPYLSYIPDSLVIYTGNWEYNNERSDWSLLNIQDVTNQYNAAFTGNSFSINFGDIQADQGFLIRYQVKIAHAPIDGEKFNNKATIISYNGLNKEEIFNYIFQTAGGEAIGYTYGISIKKTDQDGTPLKDVTFDVIRKRTGLSVGQITTDDNGVGTIDKLLKDEYILKETNVPDGYKPVDDIIISESDFDTNSKLANKTIINEKITTTTTTTTEEPKTTTSTTTEEPKTTTSTTTEEPKTTTSTTTEEPKTTTSTTTEEPKTTTSTTTEEPKTTTSTTTEEPKTTTSTTTEEPKTTTSTTTEEPKTTTSTTTEEPKTTTTEKPKLPKTGENNNGLLIVFGIAIVGLVGFYVYKRQQKN